jgi:integrase
MRTRAHGPYQHGRQWRVHFVTGSGRDRSTTYEAFASKADAQRCYDAATDEAQGLTVSAAIAEYLKVVRARGRAELTLVAYEGRLNLLLAVYLKRPLRSIQMRGPELYAATLEGRSTDGHQNLLTAGRLFGKWCVKQRWLRSNPFAEVEAVGQRTHGADKVRLSVDESRKLEAWCLAHPDDTGAVLTLGYLYLGTRSTELAAKRDVRDLDDGGRLLVIRRSKSRAGSRSLRIPDALADLLRGLCEGRAADAPIFVNHCGRRFTSDAALRRVKKICALAKVTVVPPQALRRTQASLAHAAGETALAVAAHLGHAGTVVTERSYLERGAAEATRGKRAFEVLQGGKAR